MYLNEARSELFVDLLVAEIDRLRNRNMELECRLDDSLAKETNPAPKNPYNRGLSSLLQKDPDQVYEGFKPQRHDQ